MGGAQVRLGERGCRKRVQEGLQRRIIYTAECSVQVASANSSWTLGPLAPLTVIGERKGILQVRVEEIPDLVEDRSSHADCDILIDRFRNKPGAPARRGL